jgi:hypothetical protein
MALRDSMEAHTIMAYDVSALTDRRWFLAGTANQYIVREPPVL